MFWRLERHAKTTANTRMQPKISTLLIYEVLIDNTLNRAAMFLSAIPIYANVNTYPACLYIHINLPSKPVSGSVQLCIRVET